MSAQVLRKPAPKAVGRFLKLFNLAKVVFIRIDDISSISEGTVKLDNGKTYVTTYVVECGKRTTYVFHPMDQVLEAIEDYYAGNVGGDDHLEREAAEERAFEASLDDVHRRYDAELDAEGISPRGRRRNGK